MNADPVVDLLYRLVSIPSVNPEDTDDPKVTGELRLAEFIAHHLDAKGFKVELLGPKRARPNVVARFGPAAARRRLLIEAHTDTVSVRNMVIDPFTPTLERGRLYGRGSTDTKGPMAAALNALTPQRLERLAEQDISFCFVGAMGEEKGCEGALWLAENGLAADEAIILEPTGLDVVTAHKGVLWLNVILEGVAGHGSAPDRGRNAIEAAALLIGRLAEQMRALEVEPHPLLGLPTLNTGKIEGGSAVNIIPDLCRIEFDRRYLPSESEQAILAEFRREVKRLIEEDRLLGGRVEFEEAKRSPAFSTRSDSRLVSELLEAGKSLGEHPRVRGSSWYSDAGPLAACCREVAVFGPGFIEQAHTRDEFIEIDQLKRGSAMLGAWLDRAAQAPAH